MNPPSVLDVTTPRSQRTNKIVKNPQSMLFPSHKRLVLTALVPRPEIAFRDILGGSC
jgi:hypothetical protein